MFAKAVIAVLSLALLAEAVPHTRRTQALPCQEAVDKLKAVVDGDVQALNDIDQQYNATITRFNTRTATAQQNINSANTRYQQQTVLKNTQQDKTYAARDAFNVAALHLSDVVSLCGQPQPPVDCAEQLTNAKDEIKAKNTTQTIEDAALVKANAAQDAAFDDQQMANAAYQNVIQQQDKEIGRMQDQIADASGAVSLATAAWQVADEKCHKRS